MYFTASANNSIAPSAKNSRTIPSSTTTGTDFGRVEACRPAAIGITATRAPNTTHFSTKPASTAGPNTSATTRVKSSKPSGEAPYMTVYARATATAQLITVRENTETAAAATRGT